MAGFAVVLDADALHPVHVRNTLLKFASAKLFRPLWSERILEEMAKSLIKRGVANREQLERLVYRLGSIYPDSLVGNYEHLEAELKCPDPDDQHVLAAAVASKAGAIVTFNTKDFPTDTLERFDLEIVHPDRFLISQASLSKPVALRALASQIEGYSKPEIEAKVLAGHFERSSCPAFAKFLEENAEVINKKVMELRALKSG